MGVRAGYRQTEVGVIPDDWDVIRLGALVRSTEYGSSSQSKAHGLVPVLRMGNLQGGKIDWSDLVYTDNEAEIRRYELRPGDVLFNRTNTIELVGKTSIYDGGRRAIFAGYLIRVVPRPDVLEPRFLTYVMNTRVARNYSAQVLSVAVGQANINAEKLKTYPIPMPPTLEEQRAIAAALSDVDALLDGLDRLIAKKRDIKQATMHQLLTGQTRLPGFSGEWERVSVNEVVVRATGFWGANNKDERNSRVAAIIRAGDISPEGQLTATAKRYLSAAEFERAKCQLDDLVITTSGNGLGKLWWCDGRPDVAASNFVRVLRPIAKRTVGRFLYYALRTSEGARQLAEHTATSAYPNLRPTYFSTVWIPLPPLPEQTAIARVLSDMDAELTSLEARRDKTKNLKKAMMQELLTGKTRLVNGGAHV